MARRPATSTPMRDAARLWSHVFGDQFGDLQHLFALFSGFYKPESKRLEMTQTKFYRPHQIDDALVWAEQQDGINREVYYCAHQLLDEQRVKEQAAPIWTLYADVDAVEVDQSPIKPTAVVESSPGKAHIYARLSRPISPVIAERLNRRWALAFGADPSGFDLSQVLRVPTTHNRKYAGAPLVRLQYIDDEMAYDPDDVERRLPPLPEKVRDRRGTRPHLAPDSVADGEDNPPVRLNGDALELWHGRGRWADACDRSMSLVRLAHALARANASQQTIIDALADRDAALGWLKFTERDDAETRYEEIAANAIRALADSDMAWIDDVLSGARDDPQSSVPSQSVLVGTELLHRVPSSNGSKNGLELNLLDGVDATLLREQDAPDELPSLPLLGHEGYIVLGWSNLLAAYPRTGKTELLCACIPSWLEAGHRIVYFTEEPTALWRLRLRRRPVWPVGCRIIPALGVDPALLLAAMRAAPEDIVVVDAIRNLLAFVDENDNSEVARKINPWVVAARNTDKTLELVHHLRKGAGDHGEGIAGGHALLGAVDIALELLFDQHGIPNRRRIRAWARLVQPPELLYEQTADKQLVALGDPASLDQSALEQRVLDELSVDSWRTTQEVHAALGDPKPSQEGVRIALTGLAERDLVLRDPPISRGRVRGKTHRWSLPESSVPTKGLCLGTELLRGAPADSGTQEGLPVDAAADAFYADWADEEADG